MRAEPRPQRKRLIWGWVAGLVGLLALAAVGVGLWAWNAQQQELARQAALATAVARDATATAQARATATAQARFARFCDWFHGAAPDPRWEWVDPLGGSEARIDSQGLMIKTSGGKRDLYGDNLNAPRLLQRVSAGDFLVQTQVAIQPTFAEGVMAFQGGGLVLFHDPDNYLWVALGTSMPSIDSALTIRGVRSTLTWPSDRPDITRPWVYLRISRTGNWVKAAYSLDGETWIESTGVSFPPGEAQVGMVLFSAWDSPGFWARFANFLWEECIQQLRLSTTVEVFANRGWQDTGVRLQPGDQVVVEYVSGLWTNWVGRNAPHDASGPPTIYICAEHIDANDCIEPLPDFPAGALVGRVGRQLLGIGNRLTFVTESAGNLELRINDGDEGLYDNAGSIVVRITVRHP